MEAIRVRSIIKINSKSCNMLVWKGLVLQKYTLKRGGKYVKTHRCLLPTSLTDGRSTHHHFKKGKVKYKFSRQPLPTGAGNTLRSYNKVLARFESAGTCTCRCPAGSQTSSHAFQSGSSIIVFLPANSTNQNCKPQLEKEPGNICCVLP